MKKFQLIAAGVLLAQLLFAAAWFYFSGTAGERAVAVALLPANAADADRVYISDANGQATLQQQYGGKWLLPQLHELPISDDKIKEALVALRGLKTAWPVATGSSGHERFEVSAEKHQRRIQLFKGEELLSEIYLGSSPGFRQTHVRMAGEDDVYALEVNAYDLPAEDEEWMSRELIAADNVTEIEGGDFRLRKEDDAWKLQSADGSDVAGVDSKEVTSLVNAIETLRVLSLVAADAKREPADTADDDELLPAAFEIKVQDASGGWQYRFFRSGKDFRASRNDRPQTFKVGRSDYERIAGATFAKLESTAAAE